VVAEPAFGSVIATEINFSPLRIPGNVLSFNSFEPKADSCRIAPKFPTWNISAVLGHTLAISSITIIASIKGIP